jgi:hypothetical protein
VTRCTAPMAPVVISMAVAFVLEYGATVAISTACAELVQPFVPRTHASPAIVRGQFRPRRLRIGHMETRPTEPAEPQIVRAVAHFGAIAAIKTMFADLSLRIPGLDGESHSESFRRRSRLLREYANLVHSQPGWGTCNTVISSSLSSSTMTTTTTTTMTKSSPTTTMSSLKSSSTTTTSSLTSSSTAKTGTSVKTTSSTSTLRAAISSLPSCGQTCFSNLIGQYSNLDCSSPDPSCLCSNVNFGYGIRDCSNGACGTAVASTVVAYEAVYCSSALATRSSTATTTATGIAALPSCGQICFNNLIEQYSTLGFSSPDPTCLCKNINFYYGIRDCSNGACGTAVASTVIAYESAYCASATAASTGSSDFEGDGF